MSTLSLSLTLSTSLSFLLSPYLPPILPSHISLALLSLVLLLPIHPYVASTLASFREKQAAKRLGAEIVPAIKGWLPGNLDVMRFIKSYTREKGPMGEVWLHLKEKYGPLYSFRIMGNQIINTCEPQHMQQILATSFQKYGKPDFILQCLNDLLGNGIFASDQRDLWKFHRSMTRPHFAREEVFNFTHFAKAADTMLEYLVRKSCKEGKAVDVQDLFGRFTMDTGTRMFFGVSFDSLLELDMDPSDVSSRKASAFARAFLDAQEHTVDRVRDTAMFWKITEIFNKPIAKPLELINSQLDQIITDAIENPKSRDDKDVLITHLIAETQDKKLIRDEVLNILLAARDTTSNLLTSTLLELSRHPEVLKKLRAEVIDAVGDDPQHIPEFEEVKECKYLRAVIHETLRMWPPVFQNSRMCLEDDVWTVGDKRYLIPKGTTTRYCIGWMQRSKENWGPDADQWIPERWLDDRINYMTAKPFIFQPFSAGPRICLGQRFALNQATFALTRLLQNVSSITLAKDVQPIETIAPGPDGEMDGVKGFSGLTLAYKGGVWMRFGKETAAE